MTAKWTDAKGIEWGVTTEREGNETADAQAARHSERVAALEALHPPAIPPEPAP